jgi:hypothetical protein
MGLPGTWRAAVSAHIHLALAVSALAVSMSVIDYRKMLVVPQSNVNRRQGRFDAADYHQPIYREAGY